MIIKRMPSSRIMNMKIRYEWLDHKMLFLMYSMDGSFVESSVEVMTFQEVRGRDDILGRSINDIFQERFRFLYAGSWDNFECFVDRESVEKRIAMLAKRKGDNMADVLRSMLTMFSGQVQSRKEFFGRAA